MPQINALRGFRFNLGSVGSLSDVVAPPYDVIDQELQGKLYDQHPFNIVRLILNRDEPGDTSETRYERAAQLLRHWHADGILQTEGEPALYVYHQRYEWDGRMHDRHGFICRMRLERFGEGSVYPHEQTYPSAKADRLLLTKACKANLCPVFGIYPSEQNDAQRSLDSLVSGTAGIETDDHLGVQHTLWPITDVGAISEVTAKLSELPMYIADGHHRYETACDYRDFLIAQQGPLPAEHPANFILIACFSMHDPGLLVLPTHRLFTGLPDWTTEEIIAKLGDYFLCEEVEHGPEAAEAVWQRMQFDDDQALLALYVKPTQTWLLCQGTESVLTRMRELEPDHSDEWRSLGVSILHRLVINDLLKCQDHPKPIYLHSTSELSQHLVADATSTTPKISLAALVKPATVSHVESISLFGERMPAKSTYFYPKLLSGLVINPLRNV